MNFCQVKQQLLTCFYCLYKKECYANIVFPLFLAKPIPEDEPIVPPMSTYFQHTDHDLVRSIAQGEEAALSELYERYWKKLLHRALVLLNNQEEAEEVVQDIFVAIWKKAERIEIKNGVATYLSAMLHYHCFEHLANRKRERKRKQGLPQIAEADDGTREYLAFESLQEELEKAVSALPQQCQLIFRLSREEGLTDKQIAAELDVSVNTVRTQKHRALQKLKTSLNGFFIL